MPIPQEHLYYNSLDERCKSPLGAVRAGEPIHFALHMPESLGFVEPRLVLTPDGKPPVEYRMQFEKGREGVDLFTLELTLPQTGLYYYHFDLYSDFRKICRGDLMEGVLCWETGAEWQLTVYDASYQTPDCYKGGVQYQIFPDRFFEGRKNKPMPFVDRVYRANKKGEPYFWPIENGGALNMDYFGGDFLGIMEKLPYLRSLGVNFIYLNPIFEAHSNHRYNTANYLKPDPLLGTRQEFSLLCAKAQKQGIRIILDGVFSHTGSDSLYFNKEGRYGSDGAYHDEHSVYRPWYDFSPAYPCGYRSWWGFDTLPEVNEDNPAYQEFICGKGGVIDTWLSLGAGGFRLDVADELPDDFIEKIRTAIKSHGSDKLLMGEVWEDATNKEAYGVRRTYLLGKGLDCVMNYPFKNAALDFVRGGSIQAVAEQLLSICDHYPKPALDCAMNFLSTHDTERALTAIADEPVGSHDRAWQSGRRLAAPRYERGIKQLALAYAMIFTLPGVPSIYYGDEIAMQGYKDPFNRAYFDWDSREERLRPVLKQLAQLRKDCDAFKDGRFELLEAEGDLLHYRRAGSTESAEILLNRGDRLLAATAFGKTVEINPCGFTIVLDENKKDRPGYFKIR